MLNLLMIAVGLSMDASAVSMSNGMCVSARSNKSRFFWQRSGVVDYVWCLSGIDATDWLLPGKAFSGFISSIDHWVAFVLLAFIGGKMVWEAIHPEEEECEVSLPFQTIVTQGNRQSALMLWLSASASHCCRLRFSLQAASSPSPPSFALL